MLPTQTMDPTTKETKYSSTNKVKERKQCYRRKRRKLLELKLHSSEVQSWGGADTPTPLRTITSHLSPNFLRYMERYASPWTSSNSSCFGMEVGAAFYSASRRCLSQCVACTLVHQLLSFHAKDGEERPKCGAGRPLLVRPAFRCTNF